MRSRHRAGVGGEGRGHSETTPPSRRPAHHSKSPSTEGSQVPRKSVGTYKTGGQVAKGTSPTPAEEAFHSVDVAPSMMERRGRIGMDTVPSTSS